VKKTVFVSTSASSAFDRQQQDRFHKVENVVSACFHIKRDDLRSPLRGNARVAMCRQIAMYLSHIVWGMSLTRVGQMFCRDRSTVSYACRLIEDQRDDPGFDALMSSLEYALSSEKHSFEISMEKQLF
jgi:chromosomal replication initiation ATPase DnaA